MFIPQEADAIQQQARALELSTAEEGVRLLASIENVAMDLANSGGKHTESELVDWVTQFKKVFGSHAILTQIGIDPDTGKLVKPELWRAKDADVLPVLRQLTPIRARLHRLVAQGITSL